MTRRIWRALRLALGRGWRAQVTLLINGRSILRRHEERGDIDAKSLRALAYRPPGESPLPGQVAEGEFVTGHESHDRFVLFFRPLDRRRHVKASSRRGQMSGRLAIHLTQAKSKMQKSE